MGDAERDREGAGVPPRVDRPAAGGESDPSGPAGTAAGPGPGKRHRKWKRRLAWGLGIPAAVLVLGFPVADFTYSRRVAASYRAWNATIERDADGVREGCREFTLEATGERRPTAVLMVHGFAASPDVWRPIAGILAGKGYTCRAMRLPGFAMPIDEYTKTSLARWREAVAEEVAALGRSHGRVFIVGHSMGGALTLDYALDHPEVPVGIAVLAPLVDVSGERSPLLSPRAWFRVLDALLTFTDVIQTAGEMKCADPGALAGVATERHVPRNVLRDLFAIVDRIEGRAGELRTPVLMALSADDLTIDNEAARRYFEAAGSRAKRILLVEDSSHVLPVDRGFRDLAEEIARFVRGLEEGGG